MLRHGYVQTNHSLLRTLSGFPCFPCVNYQSSYSVYYPFEAMTSESSSYSASAKDFSWAKASALWVIVIIIASLILLRIIYNIIGRILKRQYKRNREHELVELVQQRTRLQLSGNDAGIQRPAQALTRRSSEVSVLPRYGTEQGGLCDQYVEVKKKGKYSYVVAYHWPS